MKDPERKIFGTDGVRGKANTAPMDSGTALALGRAAAILFARAGHRQRIVVGKDTRLSGYMIETALASGICSAGADVWLVGPLPTPGIAFIARSMRADAGAVISASHNPFDDNGIKFFDSDGFKLPDELELRMEETVLRGGGAPAGPTGASIGKAHRIDDAAGRYIQYLKGHFPGELTLLGLRLVVDCANGAGYRVAPTVFQELGAEVIEIGTRPDGLNINQGCGSLHPERMCGLVRRMKANAGIALDGDADRVIMCDEKGSVVDGDVIMALAALDRKRRGKLARDTLVATVMSNLALDRVMREHGIEVRRTKVGDRYVIDEMRGGGFNLGGEQSGHLIFLDHNTTGDGIMGALNVLAIMLREQRPLSELAKIFEPYPQVRVDVRVQRKVDFGRIPALATALESYRGELGREGRLLVRYSGTEDIARVMVEGSDRGRIRLMANELAGLIGEHLGGEGTVLP
ncbi:MAG: phosphoglucosamine mutase [Proteobacteria bacterium]|nr:phosphoglucosamine mutase [Pseudomonadota bacterium]